MILLASASPRRRHLLEGAGLRFEVEPSEVDEGLDAPLGPRATARHLAQRKARAAHARHAGEALRILAADTVVAVPRDPGSESRAAEDRATDWVALGKACDAREAASMLGRLSGSRHQVVTGVCALDARSGASLCEAAVTWVTMRPLTPAELEAYVASGEWRDKAGAYAIQGSADAFVTALEGDGFDNVVGLPVALALELLGRLEAGGPLAGEPHGG